MPKYIFTERELAESLGMTRAHLDRAYMNDPRHPPKEPKGWPLVKWQAFVSLKKAEGAARLRGPNMDVRRQKIELECERLQVQIRKEMGQLADIAEIADKMHRRDAELAMRMNTLRESEIAKHPKHREFIERFCRTVMEKLAEDVEVTG